LRLPDGSSERTVGATAAAAGVRVRPLGDYRFADTAPLAPALVLGFGNVAEQQIRRGIRVIAEAAGS
jgi:GntR family transcriptional regulator/MocR family aminotransferase